MLLDYPGRFLYRNQRDLYLPMAVFATEYRWIVRIGVGIAAAALAWFVRSAPH